MARATAGTPAAQQGLQAAHEAIEGELDGLTIAEGTPLVQRLITAQGLVRRIEKRGKVALGGGYTYATASDVYDMVRPILAGCGIAYTVKMVGAPTQADSGMETLKNIKIIRFTVPLQVTLACEGGKQEHEWWGIADDSTDKGIAKAITLGLKSWLMATFQISSEDMDAEQTDSRASYREGTGTGQAAPPNSKKEADALRTQAMNALRAITAEIGPARAADVFGYVSGGRSTVREMPDEGLPQLLTSLQTYDKRKAERPEFDAKVADWVATRPVQPPAVVTPDAPAVTGNVVHNTEPVDPDAPAQGSFDA